MEVLEGIAEAPLTLGALVRAVRLGEGQSQAEFARRLGISKQHLSEVERGRKAVAAERAARWAGLLGYSEKQFVRLALQDAVARAGLRYRVVLDGEAA